MSIAIDLQEWQAAAPMTHAQLVGVELPRDDITQRLIQVLSEKKRLKVLELRQGVSLEASSYVGRIALGELQITIRPKIKMLPLLHLLQYTYGLRQRRFSPVREEEYPCKRSPGRAESCRHLYPAFIIPVWRIA